MAAIAARTAVRATAATAYPPLDANWIIVDFRGGDHYRQGAIDVQGDCPKHEKAG